MPSEVSVADHQLSELLAACEEVVAITSLAVPTLVEACTDTLIARCLLKALQLSSACTAVIELGVTTGRPLSFSARATINECRMTSEGCAHSCELALGTVTVALELAVASRRCEAACKALLNR